MTKVKVIIMALVCITSTQFALANNTCALASAWAKVAKDRSSLLKTDYDIDLVTWTILRNRLPGSCYQKYMHNYSTAAYLGNLIISERTKEAEED